MRTTIGSSAGKFDTVRRMENVRNVIQRTLISGPSVSVVVLRFVCSPFVPGLSGKRVPSMVLGRRQITGRCLLPSIGLTSRVTTQVQDNRFA